MRTKKVSVRLILVAALVLSVAGGAAADTPVLKDMVTASVTDLQATVKIEKSTSSELEKINRDYVMAYSLRDVTMRFREPGKLRVDSRIGLMIYNGPKRFFQVKAIGLRKTDDLGESAGQRHSLLDVGLLSPAAEATLTGTYVRDETLGGAAVAVFDATYKGDKTARYRLWFDRKTHIVLQREWYDEEDKLRARFMFSEAKEVRPGIWTPTRVEIQNRDSKTAAIATYAAVAVNQGIEDSVFAIP
jgi:outer membrane lipoprotein-sorting protein